MILNIVHHSGFVAEFFMDYIEVHWKNNIYNILNDYGSTKHALLGHDFSCFSQRFRWVFG